MVSSKKGKVKLPEAMMAKESVLDCVGFSFAFADLIVTAPDKILPFRVQCKWSLGHGDC